MLENSCGIWNFRPQWMQKYATTRSFLLVYGLLGTIQSMGYLYFTVTLSTIEKRFKIPSQTTGIILSGNEVSQIMLSLVLSYAGGRKNRPVWIAWGVIFCSLSCFILASPHFIYGAGQEALELTFEYLKDSENVTKHLPFGKAMKTKENSKLCVIGGYEEEPCDKTFSYLPLVLIFLSQFVLGIGNTLYYSLGQAYLDDNTRRTNTPVMLAYTMSLRMLGPVVGFFLGYVSLNVYIDPTKTPAIDKNDPRWLGAWWLGWIILGASMFLSAALIGLFPRHLPKKKMKEIAADKEGQEFLRSAELAPTTICCQNCGIVVTEEVAHIKEFTAALIRLLKNKVLMFNLFAGIFFVLGASGHMTFLSRYMEVLFNKSASDATIVTGPVTILGMVFGYISSGFFISKYQPRPRVLFFWNIVVGTCYALGQGSYMLLSCDGTNSLIINGTLNKGLVCDSRCLCDDVPYSPVCHLETGQTYYSPCHAGCTIWNKKNNTYLNCGCVNQNDTRSNMFTTLAIQEITSTEKPLIFHPINNTDEQNISYYDEHDTHNFKQKEISSPLADIASTTEDYYYENYEHSDRPANLMVGNKKKIRKERDVGNNNDNIKSIADVTIPGVCFVSCTKSWYIFTGIALVINWLVSTGRVGNVLLGFRAVDDNDKAFAQGLALTLVSLLALIPGPIIFGRIIDSTCLSWSYKCGERGNCQLYDQDLYRYLVNGAGMLLALCGGFFDTLVWYHCKNLNLYDEKKKEDDPCLKKLRNCNCKVFDKNGDNEDNAKKIG